MRDEAAGRELKNQRAIHLLVEGEIKRVERATRIAEAGLRAAAFEQAILSALQLVIHEHRDEIKRREPLGLRMAQARFQHVGHAGEPELAEGAIQFEEIHAVVARCSMRAR